MDDDSNTHTIDVEEIHLNALELSPFVGLHSK